MQFLYKFNKLFLKIKIKIKSIIGYVRTTCRK
jgi:hypothetical protein